MEKIKKKHFIWNIHIYLSQIYGEIFLYSVFEIIFEILNIAIPYFFGNIIDGAIGYDLNRIRKGAICLAVCLIAVTLSCYIKNYIILELKNELMFKLKSKIMSNAVLNYLSDEKHSRGIYISKFEDIDKIVAFVTNVVCLLFATLISFVIMIVMLYNISIKLAVIQLVFIPMNGIFACVLGNKTRKWEKEVISKRDNFFSYMYELLDGIGEFATLGIGNTVAQHFNRENKKYLQEEKIKGVRTLQWSQGFSLIQGITQIIILLISCIEIMNENITIGEYYIFNSYASNINSTLLTFIMWYMQYNSVLIAFEHINSELMESEAQIYNCVEPINVISGQNISFGYEDNKVFDNISFVFKKGEIAVITGKNGIGKSTLLKIIGNFLQPDSGILKVNGKKALCDKIYGISYFSANVFLFNASVLDNLQIVKPNCDKKEIVEICEKLGIDEFINSLPLKYDTKIGEKGEKISKGQLQGLALARAFLLDAYVYIFDEATTYLDYEIEQNFYREINRLKKAGKIIIIATHKLNSTCDYTYLYELKDGMLSNKKSSDSLTC